MDVSTRAEALFASSLRPADRPTAAQVEAAIDASLRTLGAKGCLCEMAHEFGEHPETAAVRMQWALSLVRPLAAA